MHVNDDVFYDSQHVTNAKFSLLFLPSLNAIYIYMHETLTC